MAYPEIRMRRLRRTPSIRRLFDVPLPGPEKFIWPLFIAEGRDVFEEIESMPGQYRMSADRVCGAVEGAVLSGITAVLLFGLTTEDRKDHCGTGAYRADGAVQNAVRELKDAFPHLVVITDVCLCAYTSHGHCGPVGDSGDVENDKALVHLERTALSHAGAGADMVAPSAMMDGQVGAIRKALDGNGFEETLLMSYSTKFASSLYGPFRDAEQSAPGQGDRKGYQQSWADGRQAVRESLLDEDEGADILMVKPGLFYLDVIKDVREASRLPLAVYNVSGEYSMLIASADRGFGDLKGMVREQMGAFVRSGADLIISYWAGRYDEFLKD